MSTILKYSHFKEFFTMNHIRVTLRFLLATCAVYTLLTINTSFAPGTTVDTQEYAMQPPENGSAIRPETLGTM
jgi:hypothetical protein